MEKTLEAASQGSERETILERPESAPAKRQHDTTIVINTSFLKEFPEYTMLNRTLDSLRLLKGLPSQTPIVITIDGLLHDKIGKYQPNDTVENKEKLQEYARRLRLQFKYDKHVTILQAYVPGFVTNSMRMAMDFVDTEYVFALQHDLRFVKEVDYTALIQSMKDNPEELHIVRFYDSVNRNPQQFYERKIGIKEYCLAPFVDKKNNLTYTLQRYSDHNHLTTKKYYEWMLDKVGPVGRFFESPMLASDNWDTKEDCKTYGQWLYGPVHDGPYIEHMDGHKAFDKKEEGNDA